MRTELGSEYVDRLRTLYGDRLPGSSDFVCYWLEKARAQIEVGRSKRAGLIATSKIRQLANRAALESIKQTGDIFYAHSDQAWVLDAASVRVCLVAFDDGSEQERMLDGRPVPEIHADLTASLDVTGAQALPENLGVAFIGIQKGGAFDIPGDLARSWLELPNAAGVSNAEVLRPFMGAREVAQGDRDMWLIDFDQMPIADARKYEAPFAYVEAHVKPARQELRRANHVKYWWLHQESRPGMRRGLEGLSRFIATPMVSKHRFFVRLPVRIAPSNKLVVITSEDDYLFGVLSSSIHAAWALRMGGRHGAGNDLVYQVGRCFETFHFPARHAPHERAVADAARHLETVRDHLLASDPKVNITRLYNETDELRAAPDPAARAMPLLLAQQRLDVAVAGAYGWEWPLSDDEILERLLALNLERATEEERVVKGVAATK